MARNASLALIPAAALLLAACGSSGGHPAAQGSSSSSSSAPSPRATTAALTCRQQYLEWKYGPANAIVEGPLKRALKKVEAAGSNDDIPEVRSGLIAASSAARKLRHYPIPACADPHGYWAHALGLMIGAGDNARTSIGLASIMLAMAPLEKADHILTAKLTPELKRDAG